MPRFSLEDLDNLAEYGETAAALTSLAAGGVTLVMPNPVTAGIAVGSNILGSAIDLYQAGRSLYKGNYGDDVVEEALGKLDESQKRLLNPHTYPVGLEEGMWHRRAALVAELRGQKIGW